MITNITLENFKCFRQVSINPKRLTVLIGPNGTGKSSILQALLLLKQSVGERHIRGESVNYPSIGENSSQISSTMEREEVGSKGSHAGEQSYPTNIEFRSSSIGLLPNFGRIRRY